MLLKMNTLKRMLKLLMDGAIGTKTELQELTASLKQGFAQMS